MAFIVVNTTEGEKVLLNPDCIAYVRPLRDNSGNTLIELEFDERFYVTETVDEIELLLDSQGQ